MAKKKASSKKRRRSTAASQAHDLHPDGGAAAERLAWAQDYRDAAADRGHNGETWALAIDARKADAEELLADRNARPEDAFVAGFELARWAFLSWAHNYAREERENAALNAHQERSSSGGKESAKARAKGVAARRVQCVEQYDLTMAVYGHVWKREQILEHVGAAVDLHWQTVRRHLVKAGRLTKPGAPSR